MIELEYDKIIELYGNPKEVNDIMLWSFTCHKEWVDALKEISSEQETRHMRDKDKKNGTINRVRNRFIKEQINKSNSYQLETYQSVVFDTIQMLELIPLQIEEDNICLSEDKSTVSLNYIEKDFDLVIILNGFNCYNYNLNIHMNKSESLRIIEQNISLEYGKNNYAGMIGYILDKHGYGLSKPLHKYGKD